jgi:hypothetical protein
MRLFVTKAFARFADRAGITDARLREAIERVEQGAVVADLGSGVVKLRLARRGQGKSGSFRCIVLLRRGERAFFVYGFAKSARDDIRPDELKAFRKLAETMLALDERSLDAAKRNGTIREIE